MKHFKKSALTTALCLAGGLVYIANLQAEDGPMRYFTPAQLDPDAPEQEELFDFNSGSSVVDGIASGWATSNPNDTSTGVQNNPDALPDNYLVEVIVEDPTPVRRFQEMCEFRWHGNQMAGMRVTFIYPGPDGAPDEESVGIPWHAGIGGYTPDVPVNNPAAVGGATDNEWVLYQPDDTFERAWVLKPLEGDGSAEPLKGIRIEGLADLDGDDRNYTVFDIYYGPFMTPGSKQGRPFEPTALPAQLVGTPGHPLVHATYSEKVAIGGNPPVGDLYGTLEVEFPPWDGMAYDPNGNSAPGEIQFMTYIADTDCVKDLPVTLDTFNATAVADGVELTWRTGVEVDNAAFYLWRATKDASGEYTNVVRMGPVAAKADAADGADYSFVDETVPGSGTFYYSIEDVDTNGISTYYGLISEDEFVASVTIE
jgi:hypothetical protein